MSYADWLAEQSEVEARWLDGDGGEGMKLEDVFARGIIARIEEDARFVDGDGGEGMSERCSEMVFKGYHEYPCSRKGTIERDGHWYCGQHDPVAVKAKNDARTAAWKAERAQEQKAHQVAAAERAVIDAAKALFGDDPGNIAALQDAVRALKAEEG